MNPCRVTELSESRLRHRLHFFPNTPCSSHVHLFYSWCPDLRQIQHNITILIWTASICLNNLSQNPIFHYPGQGDIMPTLTVIVVLLLKHRSFFSIMNSMCLHDNISPVLIISSYIQRSRTQQTKLHRLIRLSPTYGFGDAPQSLQQLPKGHLLWLHPQDHPPEGQWKTSCPTETLFPRKKRQLGCFLLNSALRNGWWWRGWAKGGTCKMTSPAEQNWREEMQEGSVTHNLTACCLIWLENSEEDRKPRQWQACTALQC